MPFTKREVKEATFQMESNKAPGPDGFPVDFYQTFSDEGRSYGVV
uniref:Uncharacterized protein n=1 Tax=Arundo donax TaxID=35708 RepID=A0A0A8YG21_ARUDO